MAVLEQVATLEEAQKNAGDQLNQALGQVDEEEQRRKEAEQKVLELNEELNSTADILRHQRLAANRLKDENAEKDATIASLQTALGEEAAKRMVAEQELAVQKASFEEAKDNAYNQGLDETESFYLKEFAEAKKFLFGQGWEVALKAAGRPEGDDLFKNILFPPEPEASVESAAAADPAASAEPAPVVDLEAVAELIAQPVDEVAPPAPEA